MREALAEMDELIEQKQNELRALEFARGALESWTPPARQLAAAPTPPAKAKAAPPTEVDHAERKQRIAARAASSSSAACPVGPAVPGKHRHFSAAFKVQVLEEINGGRMAKDVLAEHGLHATHLSTWRRQAAAGKLVLEEAPSGGGASSKDHGFYEDATEGPPTKSDDEAEEDLVDRLDAHEEAVPEDEAPFDQEEGLPIGMAASPSFPGRPRRMF